MLHLAQAKKKKPSENSCIKTETAQTWKVIVCQLKNRLFLVFYSCIFCLKQSSSILYVYNYFYLYKLSTIFSKY